METGSEKTVGGKQSDGGLAFHRIGEDNNGSQKILNPRTFGCGWIRTEKNHAKQLEKTMQTCLCKSGEKVSKTWSINDHIVVLSGSMLEHEIVFEHTAGSYYDEQMDNYALT